MRAFWQDGFAANSTKALSERLGITRSSFYNAFGSREALFREALALYSSSSPDHVLSSGLPDVPVRELITALFRMACHVRCGDPLGRGCMIVNCAAEQIGSGSEIGKDLEQLFSASIARFEALLELAAEKGEIRDMNDLPDKALALQNLLVGINLMARVSRDERKLWAAARETLEGLGLFGEPGPETEALFDFVPDPAAHAITP